MLAEKKSRTSRSAERKRAPLIARSRDVPNPGRLRQRDLGNQSLQPARDQGVQRKGCPGSCGGTCAKCAIGENARPYVQTKLEVSSPDDVYEREADRVANRVMRMSEAGRGSSLARPGVQRLSNDSSGVAPTGVALSTAGSQPLSDQTRAFMEPRFRADFSSVRLHRNTAAAEAAGQLNARAFTVGRDIWLGRGAAESDRRLMAHELTHVLQQDSARGRSGAPPLSAGAQIQCERPRQPEQECPEGTKTLTVDLVSLRGSNRNPIADLAFANNVFDDCCVQFQLGTGGSVGPSLSDTWLGGDTDLQREHSCTDVDPEEEAMRAGATAEFGLAGDIRVFYVESMTPALNGVSFPPFCTSGDRGRFLHHTHISNSANDRTLAHELGHQLLDCECHAQADPNNLLIPNGPGSNLDDGQCATIFGNA